MLTHGTRWRRGIRMLVCSHALALGFGLPGLPVACPVRATQEVSPATELREVIVNVQVNQSLPPYKLRLVPNPRAGDFPPGPKRLVGWIRVYRDEVPVQTIAVRTHGWFDPGAEDVNFDGYKDIFVLDEHGAKWGRRKYWLFDPASGRFNETPLARQLSDLAPNGIVFDFQAKEIRTDDFHGHCFPCNRTYKTSGDHLFMAEAKERIPRVGREICAEAKVTVSAGTWLSEKAHLAFLHWAAFGQADFPDSSVWLVRQTAPAHYVFERLAPPAADKLMRVRVIRQNGVWSAAPLP